MMIGRDEFIDIVKSEAQELGFGMRSCYAVVCDGEKQLLNSTTNVCRAPPLRAGKFITSYLIEVGEIFWSGPTNSPPK